MKPTHTEILGMATAILAANAFSSKVLLVKLAYVDGASPLQVLGIRMATALPFFAGLFIYLMIRKGRARPSAKDFAGMTLLGLIGYYLSSVLDFHGMQFISAGMERLLLYLYPTFIVLIRGVMERSLPTRREILALGVAYIGTGFVYHDEHQAEAVHALRGAVMVVGSAICYATYLYFSSGYIQKFGSRLYASYSSGISCIAILLHGWLAGSYSGAPIASSVILIGIILGTFCTVVPTYAMHQAIAMIGSAKVGILGTTGIFAPLFLGVVLFGEPLTPFRVGGTALVLGAVLLLGRKRP